MMVIRFLSTHGPLSQNHIPGTVLTLHSNNCSCGSPKTLTLSNLSILGILMSNSFHVVKYTVHHSATVIYSHLQSSPDDLKASTSSTSSTGRAGVLGCWGAAPATAFHLSRPRPKMAQLRLDWKLRKSGRPAVLCPNRARRYSRSALASAASAVSSLTARSSRLRRDASISSWGCFKQAQRKPETGFRNEIQPAGFSIRPRTRCASSKTSHCCTSMTSPVNNSATGVGLKSLLAATSTGALEEIK